LHKYFAVYLATCGLYYNCIRKGEYRHSYDILTLLGGLYRYLNSFLQIRFKIVIEMSPAGTHVYLQLACLLFCISLVISIFCWQITI